MKPRSTDAEARWALRDVNGPFTKMFNDPLSIQPAGAEPMLSGPNSEFADGIRFLLFRRPAADGQVSIILHLYRDGKPATKTTIAKVQASTARSTLLAARLLLLARGAEEYCPHIPRVMNLESMAEAA